MPKNFPASNPTQQSNWPFMVIAVLMAVVLWLFVRTGAQPLGQRTLLLPVNVTNNAGGFEVSPRQVEVRLEGQGGAVDRLSPDEVAVIADLSGHRDGDLVTLTVVPPQGFKVMGLSVTQVRVVTRERSSR
jgi:YbbR domain-containing protein